MKTPWEPMGTQGFIQLGGGDHLAGGGLCSWGDYIYIYIYISVGIIIVYCRNVNSKTIANGARESMVLSETGTT